MTIVMMRALIEDAAPETKKKRWSETMTCEGMTKPPLGEGTYKSSMSKKHTDISKLRAAGLVDAERDALDSPWIYYSVNRAAVDELNSVFGMFLDPTRIKPGRTTR